MRATPTSNTGRKAGVEHGAVRKTRGLQAGLALTYLLGCGACTDAGVERPPTARTDAGVDAAQARERCVAPPGTNASPHSVADVVQMLNALPKPVTLPCFLDTLPRPLELHAVRSVISAQPAQGRRSPRIFLFFDGLMLSVAPAGPGSQLLEFGEIRSETKTLKAEIAFPIERDIPRELPFERVVYEGTGHTTCGFCHSAEAEDETITFTRAFVSTALRPAAAQDRVYLDELHGEVGICDPQAEPERCAMLTSLFDQGKPVEHEFPTVLRTIQ